MVDQFPRKRPRRLNANGSVAAKVKPEKNTGFHSAAIPSAIRDNVSRETYARLEIYGNLLSKWNRTINLVGPTTVPQLWQRHMWDSAQIFPDCQPDADNLLLDLGSGGGFPGMVLAIMGRRNVHMVEADQRKCTFLRTVARETSTNVTIHNERLENLVSPRPYSVITARAFASLSKIFTMTSHIRDGNTQFVLNKGERFANELTEAQKLWTMKWQQRTSISEENAVILRICQLHPLNSDP